MSGADVFNLLFLLALAALGVHGILQRRKRKRMFEAWGERLEIQNLVQLSSSIHGSVRGRGLAVRFISASKNTPAATEVEVTCQPCAVLFNLRRQDASELGAVQRGEAIDVLVGDPELDAAWIIEGAPAERVRRILSSPALRAGLVAFSQLDTPRVDVEDGKLLLSRRGTEIGPDSIATERVELALALAEAVVADAETALEPGELDVAAATYRTARRVDPEAAGAASIAELKLVRAGRSVRDLRVPAIFGSSLVTVLIAGFVLLSDLASVMAFPLLFFGVAVTAAVLSGYRKARESAPGVAPDRLAIRWMVGCWVINVALTVLALTRL